MSSGAPRVSTPSHPGWLLTIALLPFAVLAFYHWSWGAPPGFGDHAQYLAHARALVEGRPYTDIGYIYNPLAPMLGPRAYPPGLPLTLAPIVALFGVDSSMVKVLMIVSILAFAYFAYRRLATAIPPWQAALAAGLSALALESRFGSVIPLSDPGFCALLWAVVLAVDSARTWTWKRIALVTALGVAAMAYRVPGVVVIPALALYALVSWKQHRGRALIPVAVWSISGLAVLATRAVDLPFHAYLFPAPNEIADRITSMLRVYRAAVFDLELYPSPFGKLNAAYHAAASVLLVAGTGALLWRYRRTMLTATVITYVAMLFASPVSDGRYLWPMYPALAAGLIVGATALSRIVARYVRWYPRPEVPVAAALVLVMIGALARELSFTAPLSLDRLPDAKALFTWMRTRDETQPMRVMFMNPRVLSLETRVPAMGALAVAPHVQLRAIREREITHIVWQNAETSACRARLLNALPRVYPARFGLEYQNATFRVYRVLPTTDTTEDELAASFEVSPTLCRQLQAY